MPDEDPDQAGAAGLPRYPGSGVPPRPGPSTDRPGDPWSTQPTTPGGYYPPGTTPPPRWGGSPGPYPDERGVAQTGAPLANYWARAAGLLIDGVIIAIVSLVYLVPAHALRGMQSAGTGQPRFGVSNGGVLVLLAIGALYAGLLIGLRGQTLGMMALKIKAVDARTGELIGFPRALGRDLFMRLLAALFFIPLVIDLLFPAWDQRRQTLHDKVVSSVVIRV